MASKQTTKHPKRGAEIEKPLPTSQSARQVPAWVHGLVLLILVASTVALYHRTFDLGFFNLDDPDYIHDLWSAASPEEKAAKQADLVKKSYEGAIANLREAIDMLAKSNGQAADVINKRVGESLDELKIAVGKK